MNFLLFPRTRFPVIPAGVGAAFSLLVACATVGPEYRAPEASVSGHFRWEESKNGRPAARRENWWTVFGESELNRLIAQVRSQNHDLKAGLKRLEQARALIGVTRAGGRAQVGTAPNFSRQRTSEEMLQPSVTSNAYTLPLTLDWELDLYGRIRRQVEAAEADARGAAEDLNALRLSLEAEAASRYFTLRALDEEIAIVAEGVETRKGSLQLAKDRNELGVVSELDVAQARNLLASSEADLEALKSQRAGQEAALAVLAGQPASSFRLASAPLQGGPPAVPAGVPSELLRARPDLRRAERLLAAENARVGVAVSAFYPSLSLSGNFGLQSLDIEHLFTNGARFWAISPEVYLPIMQGGRLEANLQQAQARYEEVLENYQQTVLEAIAEVETALAARKFYAGQTEALERSTSAAERAREIANAQYEGGIANYLSVLDAERTALNARRQQAVLRGVHFVNTVTLIRSLGGRW
ncbi:efflux transporter outer membrane subunit [Roseibacillus ishigakijimensis]|uniref:Efflux transporter outer membrane subunit n=1 Tax=Roseibacillus ishigakijimensis TaxID=454146 RepID=A0A934VIB1_9BACT|nr:efflux transporter outer membrane subunit [Roseibacillus ishigakijimensis]MBK1834888.1 efflux transporter outer membrane subunit [Roseibacillus ishigakijimensis]